MCTCMCICMCMCMCMCTCMCICVYMCMCIMYIRVCHCMCTCLRVGLYVYMDDIVYVPACLVCVCVCMCTWVLLHIHLCICMCIYSCISMSLYIRTLCGVCVCVHACTYAYGGVCIRIRVNRDAYVCMYVLCTYVCSYVYMCMYMHMYMHMRMYMHIHKYRHQNLSSSRKTRYKNIKSFVKRFPNSIVREVTWAGIQSIAFTKGVFKFVSLMLSQGLQVLIWFSEMAATQYLFCVLHALRWHQGTKVSVEGWYQFNICIVFCMHWSDMRGSRSA